MQKVNSHKLWEHLMLSQFKSSGRLFMEIHLISILLFTTFPKFIKGVDGNTATG